MISYVIEPHVRVGPFKFGMTVEQARAIAGPPTHRNDHSEEFGGGFMEYYDGYRLDYDPSGNFAAFEGVLGGVGMLLDGLDLFSVTALNLRELLESSDPEVEVDGAGATSLKVGVGFYLSHMGAQARKKPETVIAFAPGYYDR